MFVAFLGLVHKVYACGMLAGTVIATTRVNEFLAAMARLRCPRKLTIPLAVMLRYLPTIREDWRFIRDAMRLRDVSPSLWGFLKAPAMTVNCLYVPLLTAASRAADELSIAAVTRGIENPKPRTCLVTVRMTAADWAVMVLFAAFFAIELLWKGEICMIEFQKVSFTYPESGDGGLHDVSLTIPDGQCVLLCGRSGCGKTTLTRLVNGLIPQFFPGELTGRVLLDGEDLAELPLYRISEKVGSVFQNPRTQFFNVDSDSEIAFGLESQARPPAELRARVARTAEELGIRDLLGRSLFALSGGEKQKIAFASVYAMEPEVCLAGRTLFSNLDARRHRRPPPSHLALLKAQGKTILVAEHRLHPTSWMWQTACSIWTAAGLPGMYTGGIVRPARPKRREMGLRAVDLGQETPSPFHPPRQPRRWR